jgi:DNA polymerase III sliding clamp (beta) subunit (PCNA family)
MDFAVMGDMFYRLISSLFDTIELEMIDTQKLQIRSKSNKTTLNLYPTKGFPNLIHDDTSIYSKASNLTECLKRVAFNVGTDAQKPALMGVALAGNHAYSSDGKRISRATLKEKTEGASMNIPGSSVEHIVRLGQPDYLFRTANMLGAFYGSTKTVYVTGTLVNEFPVVAADSQFAERLGEHVADFPEELPWAIDRVRLMAPKEETDIVLSNTSQGLHLAGKSEGGGAEETLDWGFQKKFRFAVKPEWLKKAFEKTRRVDLTDVVSGQNRKLRFSDDDGFEHVLALMALKDE